MIREKKLVSIIPVRKNSTGIKNKNLIIINNKSLLERTIIISKKCNFIDQTIVSTDCKKMYEISLNYKCNSKGLRPFSLATKYALTTDVIKHEIRKNNLIDCYILLLQVTSPFRNLKLINNFLKAFNSKKKYKSAVSITHFNQPHPFKVQVIRNKSVVSFLKKESMVPRQKLPKVYMLNGMFYMAHAKQIIKSNTFFIEKTMPFIVKDELSLNLDDKNDLMILENAKKKKTF